jgi:hypothetical protein
LEYSAWSLSEQGLDWAKLVAAKKHRDRETPSKLRIIEHLRAI